MHYKPFSHEKYIIVTGAAGFIGSGIVRYLNDLGKENIILVDSLGQDSRWKNLVGKRYFDIILPDELFSFLEGKSGEIEAIIHMGACSDTTEKDADFLLKNNYRFTQKLAEYALMHDIRFIYASSAATYGEGKEGFDDDEEKLFSLKPINMYAYSKQMFDLWAKKEKVLNRLVGLKFFNVFGPNEHHKDHMASMIYKMYHKVRSDGKITLFASHHPDYQDGEQKRDFIYVKDAVKMTCSFLENKHTGIYNIGSGKATTWNQLAKFLFKAMDLPENISYIPMPDQLRSQYQYFTEANMKKFYGLGLNHSPATLEESVIDYVRNHLVKNETW